MARLSSSMPEEAVYLVNPDRMADSAAALTDSGVSQSGSPDAKSMMSMPCAAIAFAVAAMLRVGEGTMRPARAASFMGSASAAVGEGGRQRRDGERRSVVLPALRLP